MMENKTSTFTPPAVSIVLPESLNNNKTKLLSAAVLVASLGYFVDIYDLL